MSATDLAEAPPSSRTSQARPISAEGEVVFSPRSAEALAYRWRPIDVPKEERRPRGFLASLTSFFVAYHTA